MARCEFHHVGVPTSLAHDDETYMEGARLHVTDPTTHPFRIEFLRFEDGSPMPALLQNTPHAAFVVPNLEQAMAGREVVLEPFSANDTTRVGFIKDGDALIELMEITE